MPPAPQVGGLYWVATTRDNVSPSLVLELLMRMYWIARDYFGFVSEEVVRKNFLLLYELLDEVIDYGFAQNSSTERLKRFIMMEPMVVRPRVAVSGGVGGRGWRGPGGKREARRRSRMEPTVVRLRLAVGAGFLELLRGWVDRWEAGR